MIITHTAKIHIIVSVLVLCVAGTFVFFGWQYITGKGALLIEQVRTVATESEREQKFTELSRLADTTTAARNELSGYILQREDVPSFVTSGEILAAGLGIDYTTDSLKEVEIKDDYDQLEIRFTMEGRERAVRNMLHALEHVPYHGIVESMELDRSELSETGLVRMRVTLVVTLAEEV